MVRALLGRVKMSKIGLVPPVPSPGRHGVAIAVVARREAAHIAEWGAFHVAAGVRRILLYDDDAGDGTAEALARAVPAARLTVIPWRQRMSDARLGREIHNQALAYAHAAANFGHDFRWMAFIDADEFLFPKRDATLDAALARLGEARNLSLPWHMFGTSGHATPPQGGIVANYTRRARDPMSDAPGLRAFKCVVDPCHLTAVRVHSMETDGGDATSNDRGTIADLKSRERPDFYSADFIQLNHYYTRSRAELEAKIARGPNLPSKHEAYRRKVMRTVSSIEADEVEDRAAIEFVARAAAAQKR